VTHVVFLLEERSAKEMLEGLLPRIFHDGITFQCIPFQGKQDLEKQLSIKLRGWLEPNIQFVVLRDKDSEDCKEAKKRLVTICRDAGKPNTVVRIACTELESWYLGDLHAVEKALSAKGIAKLQNKQKYRIPDNVANAAEELEKITKKKYQKIAGSRAIGKELSLDKNCSVSFQFFIKSVESFVKNHDCSDARGNQACN
jgi:hypothetical protein